MADEFDLNLGNDGFGDFDAGLEGLDSLGDLDEQDLSSFGEIDTDIPVPHVRFNTKEFQQVLRNAKLLSAASGRDVVSKSISIHVEDGKMVCRATDFDSYLETKLDLLNEQNVLEEDVCIPTDILMKLAKACPAVTAILKDDEGFKMRLAGGDILLETLSVPLEKFIAPDRPTGGASVEAPEMLSVIRAMSPIVTAAVSPTERRILFKNGDAVASYMWAVVKAPGEYPNLELKLKDLQILKSLLTNRDGTIYVSQTPDDVKVPRTFITADDFTYATLTSAAADTNTSAEQMNEIIGQPGVFVDLLQLYKMVEVSADLPYSIGKVGLNNSLEGIQLAIKTKKGKDSIFTLSGSNEGNPQPLEKEVVLQSKLLRILLRSFGASASVKVSVTNKGVGIETDSLQAVCYVEA